MISAEMGHDRTGDPPHGLCVVGACFTMLGIALALLGCGMLLLRRFIERRVINHPTVSENIG